MATTKSILRAFHIFKCKKLDKNTNFEMMLKFTSFSMSKLMVPYFQPFWTPLLNTNGHEERMKNIFWYVMDFEFVLLLLHIIIIRHNKKLYITYFIFSKNITFKCHNP
jgi:hypothetical protein